MGKKIGFTYNELIAKLEAEGWNYRPDDSSWRAPGGEPCASREALEDVCEVYPALTGRMLDILLAGHDFDISMTQVGFHKTKPPYV